MDNIPKIVFDYYKEDFENKGNEIIPILLVVGYNKLMDKAVLMPSILRFSNNIEEMMGYVIIEKMINTIQNTDTELLYLVSAKEGYLSIFDLDEFSEEEIEDMHNKGLIGKDDPLHKHVFTLTYEIPGFQTTYIYEIKDNKLVFDSSHVGIYGQETYEEDESNIGGYGSFLLNKNLKSNE